MNEFESIWVQADTFRTQYFSGHDAALPLDVFTVAELDLRLDIIPFDDLFAKYEMDAMLRNDYTGLYVDSEAYQHLEHGPVWKQKRLRFTFAHELGHYVMHRDAAASRKYPDFESFFRWLHSDNAERYRLEQEANEFAGHLLVPRNRLIEDFDRFAAKADTLTPHWRTKMDFRQALADQISDKYGVNSQVIEVRFDREAIWPAQ